MKTGDIVTVRDGSYSLLYSGSGELKPASLTVLRDRHWRVIAANVTLPTDRPTDRENDAVLCEVVAPEQILFTQARFCTTVSRSTKVPEQLEIVIPSGMKKIVLRILD